MCVVKFTFRATADVF